MASLTASITESAGTAVVSPEQHAAVQIQAMQSIAASFSTTTEELAKPASLNTAMTAAVNAAVVNINLKNSNISIPSGQGATIATNSVTAATTAVLGAGMVGSATSAAITGITVESDVITSSAILALAEAITSNVAAVGTVAVTATPTGYVAPSIPVTTVVTVAPTGSTGGTGGSGNF